jgi:hypothetical protein
MMNLGDAQGVRKPRKTRQKPQECLKRLVEPLGAKEVVERGGGWRVLAPPEKSDVTLDRRA